MNPKVLLTNILPDSVMRRLFNETVLTSPTRADRFDASLIEAGTASGLRVISNFGVGYNHIDVAAATRCGVRVTNTPDVLTDATAGIAFGLLLSAARRFLESKQILRAGQWEGSRPLQLLWRAVAIRARGFWNAIAVLEPHATDTRSRAGSRIGIFGTRRNLFNG